MPGVDDRIALVTGGSRGLGLAVVKELLKEGYKTVSVSRTRTEQLAALESRYEGLLYPLFLDLADNEMLVSRVNFIVSELGGLNVIIHAASPLPVRRSLNSQTYSEISHFMKIYIDCLIELFSAALPHMKKIKYGRVVTIGTSFMLGMPPPSLYPYVVAKEALWGLTKSMAAEYGRYGITSNMVSPSMMLTGMTSEVSNAAKCAEADSNPLKRLVEPEEVARTVCFLCGESSTFINGANIPVTGGQK